MTDTRSYLAILVLYRTWPWTAVAVSSFQEWFPDLPLLIVDNNPPETDPAIESDCRRERLWLAGRSNLEVVANAGPDHCHGSGIDLGLRQCRERRAEFLVHIEPDCLVLGRQWSEALAEPMAHGAWMCGSKSQFYGPIHPTPSIWRVDVAWDSFNHRPRDDDVCHTRFGELFRLEELRAWVRIHEPASIDYWESYWDTAQRNWFMAAAQDRAVLVEPAADFIHFWFGSSRGPDPRDQRLARYLDEAGRLTAVE